MVRIAYRQWKGGLSQPFGTKFFKGIWNSHPRWTNKTVLVTENDVEGAFRILNRLMEKEGLLSIIRNTVKYEKPFQQRQRYSYEQIKAIYNEDMQRKVQFVMRKHRRELYPGQITTT